MMEQQFSGQQKRYPGPHPFAYDDRELFFGRDQEIEYLTTRLVIDFQNMAVLQTFRWEIDMIALFNSGFNIE